MKNSRPHVIVLGGFGFIGRHLVARLLKDGYAVTVFGHASHEAFAEQGEGRLRYCYGDFANAAELESAVAGCDVVFHLIGNTVPQSSNENPRYDVDAHVGPTVTLLDVCVRCRVRQLIFASSGGTVYGIPSHLPIEETHPTAPISSYGIQKLTIENYMRLYNLIHGLGATVLRISNPYGPGQNIGRNQGIIATICSRITRGEGVDIWGDGEVVRDYIYIADVVDAMERAVLRADSFQIYNVGTGIGTSINEILGVFGAIGHSGFAVNYRKGRLVDIPVNILNTVKFENAFDWKPKTSLRAGILMTLESYMEKK